MLYTDFTLSNEGQSMRVKIGTMSARQDLQMPNKLLGMVQGRGPETERKKRLQETFGRTP